MPKSVLYMRTVNHRHCYQIDCSTQLAQLLQINATFSLKVKRMHACSCTEKGR